MQTVTCAKVTDDTGDSNHEAGEEGRLEKQGHSKNSSRRSLKSPPNDLTLSFGVDGQLLCGDVMLQRVRVKE